jgi:hypothetical protein
MAVTVKSHTIWTICHGSQEVIVPNQLVRMVAGEPFFRLSSTNYSLVKLIAGGHVNIIGKKNLTLSGNTGLKRLVELRNMASGITPPERTGMLLPDAPPCKKPRKAKAAPKAEDADDHGVVSFHVLGYDGLVTAMKASHPSEDLVVSMDGSVLDIVFGLIIGHGLDLDAKKERDYCRTGKWSKQPDAPE